MERLYLSILCLCATFGEIDGLLPLAEFIGADGSLTRRRLRWLEARDRRLRVRRYGRGRRLRISYNFDGLTRGEPSIPVRRGTAKNGSVLTFPSDLL